MPLFVRQHIYANKYLPLSELIQRYLMGKQKIEVLIDQMSHYDPDNMQMGAKRVAEMVLAGQVDVTNDAKMANTIREAFMKQIDSQNDSVRSQAIKYMAQIIPKLASDQVEIIFTRILDHIINASLVEKKRQNYGACAATVIHQAAQIHGQRLQNLFLKSSKLLLQLQNKNSSIEIILIGIITEFMKKWPNVSGRLTFDRKNLIVYLLRNVQVKASLDIIKKSQQCLGRLTAILDKDHLDVLLNNNQWGLFLFINKNKKQQSQSNLILLRNGLLCLNQIIRTHNVDLRFWIRPCSNLLSEIIQFYKGFDEISYIDNICDILDAAISALANILKIFSRELRQQLQAEENSFNSFVQELLNYNVQGLMSYAGQPMEVQYEDGGQEQQYYEQQQADQKCWKVRRSILQYIPYLAKYDKNFLSRIGQGELIQDLGNKLVQQQSLVSAMAFWTFNELIQLISVNRQLSEQQFLQEMSLQRVKSSAHSVADCLIKEITKRIKVVFSSTRFNDQLKIQASKILLRIVKIYNHVLINNQQDTFQLIGFIIDQLRKTQILENKANLLLSIKELISQQYPFQAYAHIYEVLFEQIQKTANSKIRSTSIAILSRFNRVFHEDINRSAQKQRLISLLKAKIKELDSDKIVKLSVAKCIGSVFEFLEIAEQDFGFFLETLSAKYKIQIDKVYIIQALIRIRDNSKPSKNTISVIQILIKQLSQNLGSTNYELNAKTILAINKLLPLVWQNLAKATLTDLLEKSKILIKEGSVPQFLKIIASNDPKLLKPYAQWIVRSIDGFFIEKLIQCKATSVEECINVFKTLDLKEKGKKISSVLGRIKIDEAFFTKNIDESPWGNVLIGALGYVGKQSSIPALFKLLQSFSSQQSRCEVCSAIGNIVSRNEGQLVPQMMKLADGAKDIYPYIYIFKEMLYYNQASFGHLVALIEWLLSKCQKKFQAESNYFITAECIGILAFLSQEAAHTVINCGRSQSEEKRLIVANSLRFGLQHYKEEIFSYDFMRNYIETIIALMSDPKVRVRQGASRSLYSLALKHSNSLKVHRSQGSFWRTITKNCEIDKSLIYQIDYGVCKQQRDEGKNLRLQSLNLLWSLAKNKNIENQFIGELMAVTVFGIDEESSYDIALRRLAILSQLSRQDFTCFIRVQDDFITKMGLVFKRYKSKTIDDRDQIFLKSVLGELQTLNNLSKQQGQDKISNLLTQLRTYPNINNILTNMANKK